MHRSPQKDSFVISLRPSTLLVHASLLELTIHPFSPPHFTPSLHQTSLSRGTRPQLPSSPLTYSFCEAAASASSLPAESLPGSYATTLPQRRAAQPTTTTFPRYESHCRLAFFDLYLHLTSNCSIRQTYPPSEKTHHALYTRLLCRHLVRDSTLVLARPSHVAPRRLHRRIHPQVP